MPELVPACRAAASHAETGHHPPLLELQLVAYRFTALADVRYEHRTFVFGGPVLAPITALLSALGNRQRRRAAQEQAAPQWRTLGSVRVRVAPERLLVWHAGAWWSVWLSAVVETHLDEQVHTFDLYFADDAPYRFQGGDVRSLARQLAARLEQARHESA